MNLLLTEYSYLSSVPATSPAPRRSWTWKGTLSPFISGWRRRNSLATGKAPGSSFKSWKIFASARGGVSFPRGVTSRGVGRIYHTPGTGATNYSWTRSDKSLRISGKVGPSRTPRQRPGGFCGALWFPEAFGFREAFGSCTLTDGSGSGGSSGGFGSLPPSAA